jgi:hypothetical protein
MEGELAPALCQHTLHRPALHQQPWRSSHQRNFHQVLVQSIANPLTRWLSDRMAGQLG